MTTHCLVWMRGGALARVIPWLPDDLRPRYLPWLQDDPGSRPDLAPPEWIPEAHLLHGIMVGYTAKPPTIDMDDLRPVLERLLDDICQRLDLASPETAFVQSAGLLRERYGNGAARSALETGRILLPQSCRIAHDYVLDTWALAEEAQPRHIDAYLREVLTACPVIWAGDDRESIHPVLTYIHCMALCGVGRKPEAQVLAAASRERLSWPTDLLAKLETGLDAPHFDMTAQRLGLTHADT